MTLLERDREKFRDGLEAGIEQGIEQGIEKGIVKGKQEAARGLLDVLDDETIAEKIGLPLEKVRALRNGER